MAGVRLKTTSNGRGYASLLANGSRQLLSFSSGRQQFFKLKMYCLMLASCHYYVMYCCRFVFYCKLAYIIKNLSIDWLIDWLLLCNGNRLTFVNQQPNVQPFQFIIYFAPKYKGKIFIIEFSAMFIARSIDDKSKSLVLSFDFSNLCLQIWDKLMSFGQDLTCWHQSSWFSS